MSFYFRIMAHFKIKTKTAELEKQIGFCEIKDLPINFSNKIGKGSYANVYKHKVRRKDAAIKIFKMNMTKQNVLNTAFNLRKLKHINVCRFRGFSIRPSGLAFELCELDVEGEIVHDVAELMEVFCENDYYNLKERLAIVQQAGKGLVYLHGENIIHKDFKPNNCLVTGSLENIVVKIADFDDVFKIKQTISSSLTTTKLKGTTLTYVAPEVLLDNELPSKESDAYAFSISFYTILSVGGSPWKAIIPIMSDALVVSALKDGKRPSIDDMLDLYKDEEQGMKDAVHKLIKDGWSSLKINRPCLEEIVGRLDTLLRKNNRPQRGLQIKDQTKLALDFIARGEDPDNVEKLMIDSQIGYGVFSKCNISQGEFILPYEGEIITPKEGLKRLNASEGDPNRSFIYFVEHKSNKYCIDATDTDRLGRYVNDSKNFNCFTKVIADPMSTKLHLGIFAAKHIAIGEELRYDYTDTNLFWRRKDEFKKYRDPLRKDQLSAFRKSDEEAKKNSDSFCQKTEKEYDEFFDENARLAESSLLDEKDIDFKMNSKVFGMEPRPESPECMFSSKANQSAELEDKSKGYSFRKRKQVEVEILAPDSADEQIEDDSGLESSLCVSNRLDDVYDSCEDEIDDVVKDEDFIPSDVENSDSEFSSDSEAEEEHHKRLSNIVESIIGSQTETPLPDMHANSPDIAQVTNNSLKEVDDVNNNFTDDESDIPDNENSESEDQSAEANEKQNSKELSVGELLAQRSNDGHKRHCCFFCGELVFTPRRHITRNHKTEDQVKALLALNPESQLTKIRWKELIRSGDFKFNNLDEQKNDSKRLLVVRSVKEDNDQADRLPCTACLGYFKGRKIAKHVKSSCPCATKEVKETPRQLSASRALLATNNAKYPEVHQRILLKMRRDEKYLVIKNDDTLNAICGNAYSSQNTRKLFRREIQPTIAC
ncbi:uncharacterized protein [Clytia hemisphaerica]